MCFQSIRRLVATVSGKMPPRTFNFSQRPFQHPCAEMTAERHAMGIVLSEPCLLGVCLPKCSNSSWGRVRACMEPGGAAAQLQRGRVCVCGGGVDLPCLSRSMALCFGTSASGHCRGGAWMAIRQPQLSSPGCLALPQALCLPGSLSAV